MTEVMPRGPVRVRPATLAHRVCGHCRAGHCKSCHGAVRVPKTTSFPGGLVLCFCTRCTPQVRCLDCGNQFSEDVNPVTWACKSRTMCQGRTRLRQSSDRLWRMIQECKTAAAISRRQDRERREAIQAQVGPEDPDRTAASRTPRPTSGICRCCGAPTKGGEFAPGHDAKYKSKLRKLSNDGDKSAYKELVERGWA